MKIAVIGAGIVGVTTAHELAAAGHDVQVFERHGSVAAEASFANTGVLGCLQPSPGAGAAVWPRAPISRLGWAWQAWRCGRPVEREQHQIALHQWAKASRERVAYWRQTLDLPLPMRQGFLLLAHSARQQRELEALALTLEKAGEASRWLSPEQTHEVDAGLHTSPHLRGALLLGQTCVANARQYTHLIRGHAVDLGAQFSFNQVIEHISPGAQVELRCVPTALQGSGSWPPRPGATPSASTQRFDAVVVCTATDPDGLLRRLGLRLPLLTRQSCAVTMPLRALEAMPDLGPRAGITDLQRQVTITRLDQRLRVTSARSFRPGRSAPPAAHIKSLFEALDAWYPGAGRVTQAQQWHGYHAHFPDGLPAIGPSAAPGVWLNMGHGLNGWALAAGGARLLSEWLSAGASKRPDGAHLFDPTRWA